MTNRQEELNKLVNVHLGKAGDGSTVKPYVTPDNIDKELLVAVPRYLNRTDYGIEEDNLPFVGVDVWNCYEVSALTDNGYPVTGIAKIVYPANNPAIVESKSLKLYLNSYNMAKMGKTIEEVQQNVQIQIAIDLSEALDTVVKVAMIRPQEQYERLRPEFQNYIEQRLNVEEIVFDKYNEDPSILEIVEHTKPTLSYTTNALRSNCRVTNQPDWGTLEVFISGSVGPTDESFLQYVVSMRKENHFHEEIVECVFKRLYDLLPEGAEFAVVAFYTRRGGIDINPVRATSQTALELYEDYIDETRASGKTLHQ